MKTLQVHNRYRAPGGEDTVLELEHDLLRSRGHEVEQFTVSNMDLAEAGLRTGVETIWSQRSYRKLEEKLRTKSFDVVHAHNTFPQLSPSIYWAAAAQGVPVVQTLHNYRLTCANGLLLRNGRPCELCVGRAPLPALRYKCYRGSVLATGAIVAMQAGHRVIGTYENKVGAYITLTEFGKSVMVRAGLPAELIYVKPNFVPDPLPEITDLPKRQKQVAFVGRIAPEKGVDLLLDAWRRLQPTDFRLVIIGDGPSRSNLEREYADLPGVVWRGWVSREEVLRELAQSLYLTMPSRWYEGFPMVLIEALALGTPALGPDHAAFPEIIIPGKTGFLARPGDSRDLAEKLSVAMSLGGEEWRQLSMQARKTYLEGYTPEANYRQLLAVYDEAINHPQRGRHS